MTSACLALTYIFQRLPHEHVIWRSECTVNTQDIFRDKGTQEISKLFTLYLELLNQEYSHLQNIHICRIFLSLHTETINVYTMLDEKHLKWQDNKPDKQVY